MLKSLTFARGLKRDHCRCQTDGPADRLLPSPASSRSFRLETPEDHLGISGRGILSRSGGQTYLLRLSHARRLVVVFPSAAAPHADKCSLILERFPTRARSESAGPFRFFRMLRYLDRLFQTTIFPTSAARWL